MTDHPKGRTDYHPRNARMGEPTPQTAPELFSSEDIMAEIRHLQRLNRQRRHHLRTIAILKLTRVIDGRR